MDLNSLQRVQLGQKIYEIQKYLKIKIYSRAHLNDPEYHTIQDNNVISEIRQKNMSTARNNLLVGVATFFVLKEYNLFEKVSPSIFFLKQMLIKIRFWPVPRGFFGRFAGIMLTTGIYSYVSDRKAQDMFLDKFSRLDTKMGKALRREIKAVNPHSKYLQYFPLEEFEEKKSQDDEE